METIDKSNLKLAFNFVRCNYIYIYIYLPAQVVIEFASDEGHVRHHKVGPNIGQVEGVIPTVTDDRRREALSDCKVGENLFKDEVR